MTASLHDCRISDELFLSSRKKQTNKKNKSCSSAFSTLKGLPLKHDLFLTLPARDWLSPPLSSLCGCKMQGRRRGRMMREPPVLMMYKKPSHIVPLLRA